MATIVRTFINNCADRQQQPIINVRQNKKRIDNNYAHLNARKRRKFHVSKLCAGFETAEKLVEINVTITHCLHANSSHLKLIVINRLI